MSPVKDSSKKLNKAKRALAMREDKVRRVQAAKFRRSSIVFFAVLLPIVVVMLLTLDYLYRPNSFALEELQFSGSFNRVRLEEVEKQTNEALQGNFFTVDLERIRSKVLTVPWVKAVNVRRKWPNSLVLHVSEHVPHMRWGEEGWVSRLGSIVLDDTLSIDANVPTLNGDAQHVAELFAFAQLWQKQLAQHDLVLRHIDRSSSRAWVIRFSHESLNGQQSGLINNQVDATLLLGSDDVQKRLDRFLRMYSQDTSLLQTSHLVDARYPNGLAIVPVVENNEPNSGESDAAERLTSL